MIGLGSHPKQDNRFYSAFRTLPTVIVGRGIISRGRGVVLEISVKIENWKVEKSEKWSKFGQKLHEFERIRTLFCILDKYFFKIVNLGVIMNLNPW